MCGIVGFCESGPDAMVDQELLRRATDCLRHRGPDGEGFLVRGNVGFGHRRLSIIDLQGGGQPIFNEDCSIAVVFNGEIYNYQELQQELELRGHRFASRSDTEVIVHAYEEHGPACVDLFTGMFCFAIWDGRDRSVLVARDRLGKKPLFYRHHEGRLSFASELKALLVDPSVVREVDLQALDDYLAYSYVPSDSSILRGIRKLPPGHWMRWREGELEVKQYWDVDFRPGPAASEGEWVERMEAELRRAVRLRLRADVPLGVFLSGGLDSSAITALACQELGRPVKTFSIGFKHLDFDELKFARLVADRYRTDHHELVVEDRDVSIIGDLAYHLDEPFADPSALPTFMICREARKHVTVVLSGDGGDEVFAGYSRYAEARRYSRVDWIPSALRAAAGRASTALMPAPLWGRGLLTRLSLSGAARYSAQMSEFNLEERRALLAGHGAALVPGDARLYEPYFRGNGLDLMSRLQHIDQKTYLPDDVLVKVDRMSMQASLEVRAPLLDHRVVEVANSAPIDLKFRDGAGKYLLRKLLQPHVPEAVITRRKMGFGLPIRYWFRGPIKDYASELLLEPGARSARFLARQAVERILRDHGRGMRDFSRKIWALLMFEQWCRRFEI
jgi:asparagine synthase (glutamine-hydrolysing)